MKTLRIFVSSPGDVAEERLLAERTLTRMSREYAEWIELEPIFWEHEPLRATMAAQAQLLRPSDTDIVVTILWSRLGRRLPKGFERPDGSRYSSGTEFEFEDAANGYRLHGKPDLLVYQKTAEPYVSLLNKEELLEKLNQKELLDSFINRWFRDEDEGTYIAAYHRFSTPSEFEQILERHLRKLFQQYVPNRIDNRRKFWEHGSPFRGLQVFDYEHTDIFFGRSQATTEILAVLRQQAARGRAFALVLGMSGAGKSSVVRAGLLPRICEPGVIEDVGSWRRAIFQPSDAGQASLWTGLAISCTRAEGVRSLDGKQTLLAEAFESNPQEAVAMLTEELRTDRDHDGETRLILVIDQFEELFTRTEITAELREQFVEVLNHLARSGSVWVVAALRSDFYPQAIEVQGLVALKAGGGQCDLRLPSSAEITQMIRLPTELAGLSFEENAETGERLDDVLRDAARAQPEALPLLEFTLDELYQKRTADGVLTHSAYRELGGLEGSLARRAETTYQALPPDVQDELPVVLDQLTTWREGRERIGRNRLAWSAVKTAKAERLLQSFIDSRLFVTEMADDGSTIVTVAHEALLREWPRISQWVDQNRENLRIHGRVATATSHWISDNRRADLLLPPGKQLLEAQSLLGEPVTLTADEKEFVDASVARAQRATRLKVAMVSTLAILAVATGAAAIYANQQRRAAELSQEQAALEAETAEQTTEFLVDLFTVSEPGEAQGNAVTARELLDRASNTIDMDLAGQPLTQARLMETIGRVYRRLGLYEQAEPMLHQALASRESILPATHSDLASSLNSLGALYGRQGRYADAERLMIRAIEIEERNGDGNSPQHAAYLEDLANLYITTNDLETAEATASRARTMRERIHGPTHANITDSLGILARVYREQGRYEEAETLLRRELEILEAAGGREHLDIASAVAALGILYQEMGRPADAEPFAKRALAIHESILGPDHLRIARSLEGVGIVHAMQGEYAEAEPYFERALELNKIRLGPEHRSVGYNYYNFAHLKGDMGRHEEALIMLQSAQEIWEKVLGPDHPDVAYAMDKRSEYLLILGRPQEAEPLSKRALHINEKAYGTDHPNVARSLVNVADLSVELGLYAEAEAFYKRALSIRETAFGSNHDYVVKVLNSYLALLTKMDRTDEAATIEKRVEAIAAMATQSDSESNE